MITSTHAILNSALLGRKEKPTHYGAIVLGAIFPDLPMFLYFGFYLLNQNHVPGFTKTHPFWQATVDWTHPIPLALTGMSICFLFKYKDGIYFSLSAFLHSLEDLPVHSEYAHRHFLPFSNYRFF